MSTKLSDRLRPNCEAAPWVIDEVKKLEETNKALREAVTYLAIAGSSARVEIMQRVTRLVERVKALEKERDQAKSEATFWMNL